MFVCACTNEKQNSSIALSVKIDTLQTTIGNPILYSLSVSHSDTNLIEFPNLRFSDNLQLKTSSLNFDRNRSQASFELVFWDTGYIAIPEIGINILNLDSTRLFTINSDSILVEVISVKEKNKNLNPGSDGILPIKGPVKVQTYENLFFFLKIIILLFTIYGIISMWKKRVKKEIGQLSKDNYQTPSLIALDKLKKMKNFELSNEDSKKEFFVNISLILREYIENSFFVRALEMTTREISKNCDLLPLDKSLALELTSILRRADLVKYAKEENNKERCMKDLENSILFVQKSSKNLIDLNG